MQKESIHLGIGKEYITDARSDVFGVTNGTVRVFIVPVEDGISGRREKLCDMPQGRVFPAFSYTDEEGVGWRFLIIPLDGDAQLLRLSGAATRRVKMSLAEWAGVPNADVEGYERSLRSFYRVRSDVVPPRDGEDIEVHNFDKYTTGGYGGKLNMDAERPVYEALAFLCQKAKIQLDPWEKLKLELSRNAGVAEMAEAANLVCRKVRLDQNWYRSDCGMLISSMEDESANVSSETSISFQSSFPVALFPRGGNHYILFNSKNGKTQRVDSKTARRISAHACSIGRALPNRSLTSKDIFAFIRRCITISDMVWLAFCTLLGVLVGLIMPELNQRVYDDYIPMGDFGMLKTMGLLILTFTLGNIAFALSKKLLESRITTRAGYAMQNAVFYRIFQLPARFFRQYESGELAQRISSFDSATNAVVHHVVVTGLSTLFSLLSLFQMFHYSAKLALYGLGMLVAFTALRMLVVLWIRPYEKESEEEEGRAQGILFQLLTGVAKIRLSGAENRAQARYFSPFIKKQRSEMHANRISAFGGLIEEGAETIIKMVLYYVVVQLLLKQEQGMTAGCFMAFNTAFGTFSGALNSTMQTVIAYWSMKPLLERLSPLLKTEPDNGENKHAGPKKIVWKLGGDIRAENLTFAYSKDSENIFENLSFHIKAGEYIGIVGESGCGKSTLMRLLLGFEKPDTGRILYDGEDLATLNLQSVRRCIGSVLQNGKLIAGTVFDNIAISAEQATLDDVEKAVHAAGLDDMIKSLPMGLRTMLSENCGTISGGQQQRILIARALCGRPSILMFDEATSALDNITQAVVCENLKNMSITRVVIAHRLSTIRNCDRIFVFSKGQMIQGTYKELAADKNGPFYKLIARQLPVNDERMHIV